MISERVLENSSRDSLPIRWGSEKRMQDERGGEFLLALARFHPRAPNSQLHPKLSLSIPPLSSFHPDGSGQRALQPSQKAPQVRKATLLLRTTCFSKRTKSENSSFLLLSYSTNSPPSSSSSSPSSSCSSLPLLIPSQSISLTL